MKIEERIEKYLVQENTKEMEKEVKELIDL